MWLQIHKRDLLEVSDLAERGFQSGYEVGEAAQGLLPNGILIGDIDDLTTALAATQSVLAAHPDKSVFEANERHYGLIKLTGVHGLPFKSWESIIGNRRMRQIALQ